MNNLQRDLPAVSWFIKLGFGNECGTVRKKRFLLEGILQHQLFCAVQPKT